VLFHETYISGMRLVDQLRTANGQVPLVSSPLKFEKLRLFTKRYRFNVYIAMFRLCQVIMPRSRTNVKSRTTASSVGRRPLLEIALFESTLCLW